MIEGTNVGGSSFEIHLLQAALALDAGLCDVALIAYGSNQRTAGGRLVSMSEPQWHEAPYRPRTRSPATRWRRPGTCTNTARRANSSPPSPSRPGPGRTANPDAFARGPLTVEDVLASRVVSDPLSVLDCCLVTDGAAACVMVRSERAGDLARAPAYLLGAGMATSHRSFAQMPDLTTTAARESGPRAFAMAGVDPREIDLLMLYDAFTINTILFLRISATARRARAGASSRAAPSRPAGRSRSTPTAAGSPACIPGCTGCSSSSRR